MPTPAIQHHLFAYHVHNVIALSHLTGDVHSIFVPFTPYPPRIQTLTMCHLITNLVLHLSTPALIPTVRALLLKFRLLLIVALLLAVLRPLHYLRVSSQVQHMPNKNLAVKTIASQLKTSLMMKTKMLFHIEDPLVRITQIITILTLERSHLLWIPVHDTKLEASMVPSQRLRELIILT